MTAIAQAKRRGFAASLLSRKQLSLAMLAAGLLALGQAVASDPAATDASAAPATPKTGKSGKVRTYEVVTGSRLKKRVCLTPEQWAARERAAKELGRELDARPVGKEAN